MTLLLSNEDVDKALTAWAPRLFRSDGVIEESARLTRFPLRWESAAGGPETDKRSGQLTLDQTFGCCRMNFTSW